MNKVKYPELQLKMLLHEVSVKYPNLRLNPNLLGKLTDVPRHIWKMKMKSEIEIINDCNFVKDNSSLVSKKTGQPTEIVNYFEEFSKLAEKEDIKGMLLLAKDVMHIHYRLIGLAASSEDRKQLEELSEANKKLKSELESKENAFKALKKKHKSEIEKADKKYNKLAACALGGFQEKGFGKVAMIYPFEKNKSKATNLLNQDFLDLSEI